MIIGHRFYVHVQCKWNCLFHPLPRVASAAGESELRGRAMVGQGAGGHHGVQAGRAAHDHRHWLRLDGQRY